MGLLECRATLVSERHAQSQRGDEDELDFPTVNEAGWKNIIFI